MAKRPRALAIVADGGRSAPQQGDRPLELMLTGLVAADGVDIRLGDPARAQHRRDPLRPPTGEITLVIGERSGEALVVELAELEQLGGDVVDPPLPVAAVGEPAAQLRLRTLPPPQRPEGRLEGSLTLALRQRLDH